MSIDELVQWYMAGWIDYQRGRRTIANGGADYERGYADGRAAYEAARRAERERLERCPGCVGTTIAHERVSPRRVKRFACPDCHGTGKRRE